MEFEFIKEKVVPDHGYFRLGKWAEVIEEWIKSDSKTLKFVCKNPKERNNCAGSARNYAKSHNYDYTIYPEKGTNNIYLVRS